MNKNFLNKISNELNYFKLSKMKTNSVSDDSIVFLGNQKSGTSVISALFANACGREITLDFRVRKYIYKKFYKVVSGEVEFPEFVLSNKYEFSKGVIKEPNLSLIANEVLQYFGGDRVVVIVRDPLENTRSIMERLQLNHDARVDDLGDVNFVWKAVCSGSDIHSFSRSNMVFDNLILRWKYIYENCRELGIEFVRYEDFIENKVEFVQGLCEKLNVGCLNSIEKFKDQQYQPKGSGVAAVDYFSNEQISFMTNECSDLLRFYRYVE